MKRITVCLLLLVSPFVWSMSALEAWEARKKPGVSFEQWQKDGKVKIKSWLKHEKDMAPGEQNILYIDVSTDNWFAKGTYIGAIEAKNAIAKRRKSNSVNSVQRVIRDNEFVSRSHQLFEITIYPTHTGEVIVPSIPVIVTVATAPGKEAKGTLYTDPIRLKSVLPDAELTSEVPWVTASSLSATQEIHTVAKDPNYLTVGDAVKRVITTNASDTLSILLPPTENPLSTASGKMVQTYPSEAELHDYQIRGDYRGQRVETTTYILKTGGQFTVPEQTVMWWDSKAGQVRTEVLPAVTLDVHHTPLSFIKAYWLEIASAIGAVIGLVLLWQTLVRLYRRQLLPQGVYYRFALMKGKWSHVRLHLYRRLNRLTGGRTLRSYSDSEEWVELADEWQAPDKAPTSKVAKGLWQNISQNQTKARLKVPRAIPSLKRFNS